MSEDTVLRARRARRERQRQRAKARLARQNAELAAAKARRALPVGKHGPTAEVPYPHRITTALNIAGLYGPEVDVALGGAEPMVDQWESGELIPTREQIVALALLTGFHPVWFYRPCRIPLGSTGFLCTTVPGELHDHTRCEVINLAPHAPDPEPEPPAQLADVVALRPRR